MLLVIKKWRQVSKNVNGCTVFSHGFEKCKVMLRKPSASFVAVKSEHIDLIEIPIINTSVMPFPIIPCGRMVTS